MTAYMLDTNIISDLIRNPSGRTASRLRQIGEAAVCTSIVVAAELRYGCARKGSPQLSKKVEDLLSEIAVLPLDAPADAEYGRLRSELETAGTPIGQNDLLISAHACAIDAVLVTGNVKEFSRVRGLKVENWLTS